MGFCEHGNERFRSLILGISFHAIMKSVLRKQFKEVRMWESSTAESGVREASCQSVKVTACVIRCPVTFEADRHY